MAENLTRTNILEHISIVLIDDDTASVASLSPMLQQFSKYVMKVDVASKALSLIEEQKDIGLVIANVEIPQIDSHSFITTLLQKHIPLILINPKIKTQKTSDLLSREACFYLTKPISENDIKNMWQHVLHKKSQEAQELKKPNITKQQGNVQSNQIAAVSRSPKRQRTTQGCRILNHVRRRCPLWNDERHMNFLSVISILGDKDSVPKSIMKLMNDPNLNYHQIASHLQKFRAKVKQISDPLPTNNLIQCNSWLDSLIQKNSSSSSFVQSSFNKPVLEENLVLSNQFNNSLVVPNYVLPQTQQSLVPSERSNAALVNMVPPETNIEEKNYDPIEDIISFDIDNMDMLPWSEDFLGHDSACNNLMEYQNHSMELGSTRPQHNLMESGQNQNIESTNQREGINFGDYRDCINRIEEMMNKDESFHDCLNRIEEMLNKDETG